MAMLALLGAPQAYSLRPRLHHRAPAVQMQADAPPRALLDRPLKVAVAGGGVGGLTTALAMLKAGFDVTVYEKTGQFARFGGPIQFASNALSTLKAIDETLFERVMDAFTFTGTRRCGIKDGLRADGTFRMSKVADPAYLVDETTPADWYLAFPLKECADFFKLPCAAQFGGAQFSDAILSDAWISPCLRYTGVIDRPDLQDILLDECRKLKPDFIVNGAGVSGYATTPDGVRVSVASDEVDDVMCDVLVGADGIWSAVRAQMYNEGEVKAKSADGLTQQGCPYSGYTVFAGEFVPEGGAKDFGDYFDCGYKVRCRAANFYSTAARSCRLASHRAPPPPPCQVYIGPRKYFVTSDVGNGRVQWYSFLCKPPGTKRAGDSWEGGASTDAQGASVIDDLRKEHEGWTEEIQCAHRARLKPTVPAELARARRQYTRRLVR